MDHEKKIEKLIEHLDCELNGAHVLCDNKEILIKDYTQLIMNELYQIVSEHEEQVWKLEHQLIDLKDELDFILGDLKKQVEKLEDMDL